MVNKSILISCWCIYGINKLEINFMHFLHFLCFLSYVRSALQSPCILLLSLHSPPASHRYTVNSIHSLNSLTEFQQRDCLAFIGELCAFPDSMCSSLLAVHIVNCTRCGFVWREDFAPSSRMIGDLWLSHQRPCTVYKWNLGEIRTSQYRNVVSETLRLRASLRPSESQTLSTWLRYAAYRLNHETERIEWTYWASYVTKV